MYEIKVDASELKAAGELLKLSGAPMRKDLATDVLATSAFAQGIARGAAPIFRGILVNSIQVDPLIVADEGSGLRIMGGISTTQPYAIVQDEGRRPHRPMPPLGPIIRWVELKVGRGDMQLSDGAQDMASQFRADAAPNRRRRKRRSTASRIRGLAFVIARSIGRKGIKGKQFFMKAGEAAKPHFEARVNATLDKWIKNAGGP